MATNDLGEQRNTGKLEKQTKVHENERYAERDNSKNTLMSQKYGAKYG